MKRYRAGAASVLILGLLAGCGGMFTKHTTFQGDPTRIQTILTDQSSLALTLDASHPEKAKQQLTASAYDSRGLAIPNATFAWRVLNSTIATVAVDQSTRTATVTGLVGGTTTLVVTNTTQASNGTVGVTTTVPITVGISVPRFFTTHIQPLAQASCDGPAPCHGGNSVGPMSTYSNARKFVVPGKPNESRYYTYPAPGTGHAGGPAWGNQRSIVGEWIEQGALENPPAP